MPKMKILYKVIRNTELALSLVFIFVGYFFTLRPVIEEKISVYSLGFADGALLAFLLTFIPLAYLYYSEKEKKKKTPKR